MREFSLHPYFAHPWVLTLLVVIPLLGVLGWWSAYWRQRALWRWGVVAPLAIRSLGVKRRLILSLARIGGLALMIMGIAGPQWGKEALLATALGRDVVVVLDMSRSMLAQDVLGQTAPNRLGRARDALIDLADYIEQRGGHRLALVVFAARAKTVCPLTNDYDHFREAVLNLDPDQVLGELGPKAEDWVSGTRLGEGISHACQLQAPGQSGQQDMIVISDGDDPAGDDEWRQGVASAKKAGIPVFTVGVGNPEEDSKIPMSADAFLTFEGKPVLTRLHEEPLQEIARLTGGAYVPARTKKLPLGELFQTRIEPRAGRETEEDLLPEYTQRFGWFFGSALAFLVLELIAGVGGWNGNGRQGKKEWSFT